MTDLPSPRHTVKPGTPEHGTAEHGTPAERQNNAGTTEHHRNTEQRNAEQQRNSQNTMEQRWNTGTTEHHEAFYFLLPSIFIRAQSYESDEQVRESYLKIFLEENFMKMKILLPF